MRRVSFVFILPWENGLSSWYNLHEERNTEMSMHVTKFFMAVCFLTVFLFLGIGISGNQAECSQELTVGSTYYFTLKDGSRLQGKLVRRLDSRIVIENPVMGDVTISEGEIKEAVETSGSEKESKDAVQSSVLLHGQSKYRFPNPNFSRYLIGHSAIPLKKGEGYYENTMIFLHSGGFGITDFFSLTGGIELISTVTGHPAFFLSPKLTFPITDNIHLGGSIFYANAVDAVDEDFEGLGFASALFTYGNKDHNLTTGLGWGYVETDFSSKPVITLSGMTRLSTRIGLVTENWFVPEPDEDGYEPVFSYGIRFMGEKIAVDLMFINHPEIAEEIILGIPIVNFTFNF